MLDQKTSKKLLIVWVYYPAVGHLIEAIEVAANYHNANPNLEIHVLVNSKTPYKIGYYCDFIFKIYPVEVSADGINATSIKDFEQIEFDYVIFPKRLIYSPQDFPESLLKGNLFLQDYFKPKIWGGYNNVLSLNKNALQEKPYSPYQITIPKDRITFNLPDAIGKPIFSVMLKGASKATKWPSLKMWKTVLLCIKHKYPESSFLITGLSSVFILSKATEVEEKNRIFKFINSIPGALNCFDLGLDNQLAVIQNSDIFIAPHTGFAFLAPCLGTPWLALSGGEWAEEMPAQMPFYSVLPSCEKYPCNGGDIKFECKVRIKLKQPIKCMSDLKHKTDDILIGIEKLLNTNYSYDASHRDYEMSALRNKVNFKKLWRIESYKTFKTNK
jgi:hypothetical protein